MPINEQLLMEFDHEMTATRAFLERAPEEQFAWRPHPKSMELAHLLRHLADIPDWVRVTFTTDRTDVSTFVPPPAPASRAEVLATFDANVAGARAILAGASDDDLRGTWSMCEGDRAFFTMPRQGVFQMWIIKHLVHHRAQLGVYLRLLDVTLPPTYGPTADGM